MSWRPLALVIVLLAGCGAPSSAPDEGLPAIAWGPMKVDTTATEPFELQGDIHVDWQDGAFGIDTEMEIDLPRYVQRDGDVFYTSERLVAWEETTAAKVAASRELSNRVLLWDLPRLMEAPFEGTVTEEDGRTVVRGATTIAWFSQEVPVDVEVRVEDGRAVHAVVASPQGRESPFTFTAVSRELGFDVGDHEPSKPAREAQTIDREARPGHDYIAGLIRDHHARRGSTPETVDPQSLALEHSLSGRPWPTSPVDGEPMRDALQSGHFKWSRCSPQDATFLGIGWDGTTTFVSFGRGCNT